MQIGRGHIHSSEQTKRIYKVVALPAFDMLGRIKATDPGGFLNLFDALCIDDRGTRLGISPNSFAFGFSQGCQQTKPGAFQAQAAKMVEQPFARAGSWLEGSAKGSPCAAQRRSHQRWSVAGVLVVCHVWAWQVSVIADMSIPHQTDCWDSSFQSITWPFLCYFQNTL